MEISDRKRAANRANAVKSTGPKTPEGKRNSALNSKRRSRLANSVLVDSESRERFNNLFDALNADFNPQDATEYALLEKMAASHWRVLRIVGIETAGLNHETRRQVPAAGEMPTNRLLRAIQSLSDAQRYPDLLGRLERRYNREYYAALEAFKRHRREKNREKNDKKSAGRSHQPHESKQPAPQKTKPPRPFSIPNQPQSGPFQPQNPDSSTSALSQPQPAVTMETDHDEDRAL